jgi:hypothetical protein
VALLLGIFSTGAGHGDYFFTKLLFPYTMLSTHVTDEFITTPFIILALFQFPFYGALIGFTDSKIWSISVAFLLAVIHVVSAVLCFVWPMPNFS